MSRQFAKTLSLAVLLALTTLPAFAQDEEAPRRKRGFSSLINVDLLLENHARMLARRYNLTEDQAAFTKDYLKSRADEFLAEHRDDLFDLADRMFEVRAGGDMSPQELIDWGKHALPLYNAAKHLIIEGNTEWREILTDEQRKIHDQDLAQMYDSFQITEGMIDRMVAGEMTVDEFRAGPRAARPNSTGDVSPEGQLPGVKPPVHTSPPAQPADPVPPPAKPEERTLTPGPVAPVRPTRGGNAPPSGQPGRPVRNRPGTARPGAATASENFKSEWEKYTQDFITRYQLDDAQSQKANSILKDCQTLAANYMLRSATQLKMLEQQTLELAKNPDADKAKLLAEISEKKKRIMAPIAMIFEKRLKPRLEQLPTAAQRANAVKQPPAGGDSDRSRSRTPPRPGGDAQKKQ